ncbi:aldehyde dehydrogenase (NAD+) [Salinibacter ruber]|uniref:aldehyde dehydrogenase family protein n=1 Tax=Salinibacter ruber TaxID=146919 RepID=UPI00216855C1|nr:aldehyde dehydrogenase family protein [Salinibacter ruber]MCS3750021.1 aldehyde dehydrogenase (NAD+) [Salinibacter ruber]
MPDSLSPPPAPASADEIERVFAAQQAHAPAVRAASVDRRRDKLRRLCDGLRAHRTDFQDAIHSDFRKAPAEVDLTEMKPLLDEAQFAINHLDDWMAPDRRSHPAFFAGTRSEIHYEPKGVALILAPWNYPLTLTLGPLIGALAAGNCVTLKPSEKTPHTNVVLKKLIGDLYEEREVALLTGAKEVAQGLLEQPYDHVYFTGSPRVGRLVMKDAADHLASVTLELGGKSPAIVDETADLDLAAERIAWSKFTNAGQTCIAPDYVLVDAPVHDALLARLIDTIEHFYGATAAMRRGSDDYARLIDDGHWDRVVGLLEEAVADGATVAVGGQTNAETRYVSPTILTDVPLDTAVMQAEIFGPLLPIIPISSLNQAVGIVNDRPNPLSMYLFTERDAMVDTVLGRTTAGSTCINEGFFHYANPDLPFGGAGHSGIGRGHGEAGFRAFSNERSVLRRRYGASLVQAVLPPFTDRKENFLAALLRYFSGP